MNETIVAVGKMRRSECT